MAIPAILIKALTNKYVILVIIIIVVGLLLKKGVKKVGQKRREKKFNKKETEDPNILAQQYRTASNPSGISWMINIDGTDEDAIEKLAFQSVNNLDEIASAYRQKFGEGFTDRIGKELEPDEFQEWKNIVT